MAHTGIGSNPFRENYNPTQKLLETPVDSTEITLENAGTTQPIQQVEKKDVKNVKTSQLIKPKIKHNTKKSSDLLDEALKVLAAHGLEIAEKKLKYVKHTFEVEETLFNLFNEIQPIITTKVKEAINEALQDWCDKYRIKYEQIIKVKSSS